MQKLSPLPRSIPINTFSWPCTHNAFNSDAEIGAGSHEAGGTNQNHSITAQLIAGIRALMIDVHEDRNAPRVRHVGGIADADLPYEDLCDLLIKIKKWLDSNNSEVIMLLMEVTNDVEPQWIKDTFEGRGPITRTDNYDLSSYLYEHNTNTPWPSIDELVQQGKRVIVFRETDDDKGRTLAADGTEVVMGWYHDMWEHWLETPYSNKSPYWTNLQKNTYILSPASRGNPNTATFFNLNHFVDTGTYAAGSAGMAEGMNRDSYLEARARIAWKMQALRPTISVDFFKSLASQTHRYNTFETSRELNRLPTLSGEIRDDNNQLFNQEVFWSGVNQLTFTEQLGKTNYLDWTIDDTLVKNPQPKSRRGYFCFPSDGPQNTMTLVPSRPGFYFEPASIEWDGADNRVQTIVIKKY